MQEGEWSLGRGRTGGGLLLVAAGFCFSVLRTMSQLPWTAEKLPHVSGVGGTRGSSSCCLGWCGAGAAERAEEDGGGWAGQKVPMKVDIMP